jgi:hypothetical protein
MGVFPVIKEPLPDDYARAVGLVVARWAYQEWLLIEVLSTILGIGPKEARHVLGTGQGIDYVPLIRDLIWVQKLTTRVDLSDLRRRVQDLREKRNTLAHGLWLRDEAGVPCLQDTTGKWPPEPGQPEVTRKIKPGAWYFNPEVAADLIAQMDQTIGLTRALLGDLQSQRGGAGDVGNVASSAAGGFSTVTASGIKAGWWKDAGSK